MGASVGTKPVGKTIELSDFFARRVRTVEIEIGDDTGDTFWVKYKPDALTKKVQAEIDAAEGVDTFSVLLETLLAGWSFTVDGEPYAVTRDNLEALGLPALRVISAAVTQDVNEQAMGKAMSTAQPPDSNGS